VVTVREGEGRIQARESRFRPAAARFWPAAARFWPAAAWATPGGGGGCAANRTRWRESTTGLGFCLGRGSSRVPDVSLPFPLRIRFILIFFKSGKSDTPGIRVSARIGCIGVSDAYYTRKRQLLTYRCFVASIT
jgi:hypothetical protein